MIILILILGLLLRLVNLNQSLWFDEAINVVYARDSSLIFYLSSYIIGDFHPPGWFFILWIFTHILGTAEIIVRMPAVIFGVMTIYLTYLIGREFSKKTGLIAALLMSLAPLHIYYSQEARPYALGALAVSLSSYFFLKFLQKSAKKFFWFLVLGNAFVLYSDYPAYLIFIAQLIFLLINFREKLAAFIKALVLGVVLFSPALSILVKQLVLGTKTAETLSGWAQVVGGNDINNILLLWVKLLLGRISIENQALYILAVAAISSVYLLALIKLKIHQLKRDYFLCWFVLPPLIGILISIFVPIFSYFRFLYILPAFYLLLACGLGEFKGWSFRIMLGLLVILQITFSFIYLFNPYFHREQWREAVSFWDGQNIPVYFENAEIIAPYRLYSQKNNLARPALKKVPASQTADLNLELNDADKILLVEYLVDITDPNRLVEKELDKLGYSKQQTFNFRGVGLTHLYRK